MRALCAAFSCEAISRYAKKTGVAFYFTTPLSGAIIDSIMSQLVVRNIEEKVVRRLKQRAGEHGISMEEAHRRILRETLLRPRKKRISFIEHLKAMPAIPEEFLVRQKDYGRNIEL